MSTVAQKLGIKPGTIIAVDGQPLDDVSALLGDLPENVSVVPRTGSVADQVILAADGLTDLAFMLTRVWSEIARGGRLWVWYRKGANKAPRQGNGTPLHRDTLQVLLAQHGMVGVTLIAVDDTWSAMRVREV
jgi:hypothetical protein